MPVYSPNPTYLRFTTKEKRQATLKKYNNSPERKAKMREYFQKNKAKWKIYTYRRYGLTEQQYNEMLVNQNFSCAICKTHMSECTKQGLCVDHDHETGQVRGLLCKGCNIALGEAKENTETLKEMINYVNRFAK